MIIKEQHTTELLFPEMPNTSKVWIYQANRMLTDEEESLIREKAVEFVGTWNSHGSRLRADFTLLYHLFLVFSVDENQHEASGCSIDKSVHFVKEIQNTLGINFFDRTIVAYFDSSDKISLSPLSQIKEAIAAKSITNNSLIFSNLQDNLGQLREKWIVSAGSSWLSRFF